MCTLEQHPLSREGQSKGIARVFSFALQAHQLRVCLAMLCLSIKSVEAGVPFACESRQYTACEDASGLARPVPRSLKPCTVILRSRIVNKFMLVSGVDHTCVRSVARAATLQAGPPGIVSLSVVTPCRTTKSTAPICRSYACQVQT